MTTPTPTPTSTPAPAAGPSQSRFNRFMAGWLQSPLGALSGRVVLVRYVGRERRRSTTLHCRQLASAAKWGSLPDLGDV